VIWNILARMAAASFFLLGKNPSTALRDKAHNKKILHLYFKNQKE